jgi:hypothetical protein
VGGERLRHQHRQVVIEAERTEVEQLVVQRAQREPVVELVGTVEVEPAHVGALDAGSR